jgi:hypothetical protein
VTSDVWITTSVVFGLKLGIAIAMTCLLLTNLLLRRAGRADNFRRTRDGLLLVLGLAGGLGWWHFLGFPVLRWVHHHDFYHYFLGARYFPELGYTRLYACTIAADVDAGVGDGGPSRRVRNLETNVLELGPETTAEREACKARFTPERWQAFSSDVSWFRRRMPAAAWRQMQMDHGFNGSPVWLLAGSLLASAEGDVEGLSSRLTRVDHLLVVGMWAGVVAAFGWRAACVAAVFWGTNGFASFDWTGGSFLRQDWLVALVLGIACLRRQRAGLAGALLTFSALLRVFPGIPMAVLALKSGLDALRTRRLGLSPGPVRFALGCAVALALLVPLAAWHSGAEAWVGFVANSRKLLETPLLNQMGLRAAVVYEADSRSSLLENPQIIDPFLDWKVAQKEHLSERWWLIAAFGALYLALLVRALRANDDWIALALGTGAIPMATQLTCYYHAALVGLALLWVRREGAGIALCALAAVSQALEHGIPYSDTRYAWMSLAEVATIFFVTWLLGNAPRAGLAQPTTPTGSGAKPGKVSAGGFAPKCAVSTSCST